MSKGAVGGVYRTNPDRLRRCGLQHERRRTGRGSNTGFPCRKSDQEGKEVHRRQ